MRNRASGRQGLRPLVRLTFVLPAPAGPSDRMLAVTVSRVRAGDGQ